MSAAHLHHGSSAVSHFAQHYHFAVALSLPISCRRPDAAGTRGRLSKQSLPVEVNGKSIIAFLLSLSTVGGGSHSTGIQFGGRKVWFRSRWSLLTAEVKRKGLPSYLWDVWDLRCGH